MADDKDVLGILTPPEQPIKQTPSNDPLGILVEKKNLSPVVANTGKPSKIGGLQDLNSLTITPQSISNAPIIDHHVRAINQALQRRNSPDNSQRVQTTAEPKERSISDRIQQALYLPAFNKGFNDLLVKPAAGATDFIDRTLDKVYSGITGEETPDWLRKKGAFDKLSASYDQQFETRDKPKNTVSEIGENMVAALPLMASLYSGEGEASLISKAPQAFSKMTKLMAATGAANAYKDATDAGNGYVESLSDAGKGAINKGIEGMKMEAQMMVGGALGKGVANKLIEKGLPATTKGAQAILHALGVGTVFAGTSAGEDLLNNKDIDTHEALKQFGTGLAFELVPIAKGFNEDFKADYENKKINREVLQNASLSTAASNLQAESALRTLIHTPDEQLQAAKDNIPDKHEDLYANSIEAGAKAFETNNPQEKRDLYTQQLLLKAQGDIAYLHDKLSKDEWVRNEMKSTIADSEGFSDEEKQSLLSKIDVMASPKANTAHVAQEQPPTEQIPAEQQTIANSGDNEPKQTTFTNADIANTDPNEPQDAKIRAVQDSFADDDKVEFKVDGKVLNGEVKDGRIQDEEGNHWGWLGILTGKDNYIKKLDGEQRIEAPVVSEEKARRQKAIDAISHGIIGGHEKAGEIGARFDLGMKADEKAKALNDIRNGNYDTAPAKRMIAKVMEFDSNDNYPIIEGTGGSAVRRQGATSAEIQEHIDAAKQLKLNNNLSEAEIVESNKALEELGITHDDIKQYEEYRASQEQPANRSAATGNEEVVQQPSNDRTASDTQDRGGEKPQAEPAVNHTPEITGIRNADVQEERKQSGQEDKPRTTKTKPEIDAEGKRLIDSGDLHPETFAEDVVKKPRPISAEEESALTYHKTRMKNRVRELENEINSGKLDEATIAQHQVELARLRDNIELNRQATEIAGNELGRGLGYRTELMNEDYSRESVMSKAKSLNKGKELSKADVDALEKSTKRIEELEAQLEKQAKEKSEKADKEKTTRVRRKAELEGRETKRLKTKAELKEERDGLVAELHKIARKSLSSAGANKIPVDMLVPLAKLARNYVQDGLTTIASVADKIHNDLKDHIEGLTKEDVEDAIHADFDKYLAEDNKERLDKSKGRLQAKLEKLRDGTYNAVRRRVLQPDKDFLKLKAEIGRQQAIINKRLEAIEFANMSNVERARLTLIKWTRNLKLAGVGVLGKLSATGIATVSIKLPEELIGGVYSKILPKIAERSSVEGGFNGRALAKAYVKGITVGMKDAYDTLNIRGGGKSDIEALYGKTDKLPAEAIEFLGHLHSAIKAPFKRTIFEFSLEKRMQKAIQAGVDVSDPVVQAKLAVDAYKDATAAIFMKSNALTSKISNLFTARTDEPLDKVIETVGKILVPFAKVSTNIGLSTGRLVAGLPVGIGQVFYHTFTGGMKDLTPEQADLVLHNLKRGTLGGGLFLLGFLHPQNVGGFYQPNEHRKEDDVKEDRFRIFGTQIPLVFTEHPIFLVMQLGATFRRVLDTNIEKGDKNANEGAVLATMAGLVDGFSYADESKRLTKALESPKAGNYFMGDLVKGNIVPQFSSELSKSMDTKDGSLFTFSDANMQRRATVDDEGIFQAIKTHVQSVIPHWREQLAVKGEGKEDKSISVIKTLAGEEYKLSPEQVKEREKLNEELRKKYNDKLVKHYTLEADRDKDLRLKIKTRSAGWEANNVSAEKKKEYKQNLVDAYVEKKVRQFLNKKSAPIIFRKYKGKLTKVEE